MVILCIPCEVDPRGTRGRSLGKLRRRAWSRTECTIFCCGRCTFWVLTFAFRVVDALALSRSRQGRTVSLFLCALQLAWRAYSSRSSSDAMLFPDILDQVSTSLLIGQ